MSNTYRTGGLIQVWAERMSYDDAVEQAQNAHAAIGKISDAAALAIAAAHGYSRGIDSQKGRHLSALAGGAPVLPRNVLDDIRAVQPEANDVEARALDMLAEWIAER